MMLRKTNSAVTINVWTLAGIVIAVLLVFIPVAWHDFVDLDDPLFVSSNTTTWTGITMEGIRAAFTSDVASNWVPLTMISHMLDVQMFGMNPSGHHLVNALLHVGSTALLFSFFNRAGASPVKSAAIALVFALHPLQVEPVAWIAERRDVLSGFFWMLTMCSYLSYCHKRTWGRYVGTLALYALGLLSKPMVVSLPVILLLVDWWPLGRLQTRTQEEVSSQRVGPLIMEKIPFFVLSACISIVTFVLKETDGEIVNQYGLIDRMSRASVLYFKYILKIIMPIDLAVYYPGTDQPPNPLVAITALLMIVLCTSVAFAKRKQYPYLITGWIWFLTALLPVIGIVQTGACTFADRYVYIPIIGLAVIAVWGGGDAVSKLNLSRRGVIALLGLSFFILVPLTSLQLTYWTSSLTLLSHAVEVTEGNWLALNNLGQELVDAGKVDEAMWYFSESVKANPSYVIAWTNLAAVFLIRNRREEAMRALQQALQLEPSNQKAQLLMQTLSR